MNIRGIGRIAIDILVVNGCYIIAFFLRFGGELPSYNFIPYVLLAPVLSVIAVVLFNVYGMYDTIRKTWNELFFSIICSIGLLTLFGMALAYFSGGYAFPRSVFIISLILQMAIFSLYRYLLWKSEKLKHGTKEIILIGNKEDLSEIIKKLENDSLNIHRVKGLILSSEQDSSKINGYSVLGHSADAEALLSQLKPDEVIVGPNMEPLLKDYILRTCLDLDISLYFIPDIYDIFISEVKLVQIDDIPLFQVQQSGARESQRFLKRLVDIVISLVGIIVAIPLIMIIGLLIKADSRGSVFYKQDRVSEQGKIFKLIKFRTMINDAEALSGPTLATENDSRITRVGKFLRAIRLDEIPQLFNVLLGDMSLVGPRPERPFFVNKFKKQIPDYVYRQKIKSGITGLAQVAGKYSTTPQDKLRYDLLYAKKSSILFDIKILFQTIKVILMKDKTL